MGRDVTQGLTIPLIKATVPPMFLLCPGGLPQLAQQGRRKIRLRYFRRQQAQHVIAGHLRIWLAVLLSSLLAPLPGQAEAIPLFGTVEFRRPLDSLPAWAEVRRMNELEPIFVSGKVFTRTATWDSFKQGAQGKSGMELLRYVNTFWNRFPYREDITNWGKADYWVWPNLFLKKSGDCEDYAIVKYFTLKELGMDTDKLRIVVLRDTLRRLSHAVLAVYMDNDIVILDNISNAILPQGRLRHYVPQFSFNEKARWAHMRGKKTNE